MFPIRLPRAVSKLKAFAEVVTRSHDRAVEIQQDATAAIATAADGRQLCRITIPPPAGTEAGPVEPFLVDARALAKAAADVGCGRTEPLASASPELVAAADRPIMLAKVDAKTVAIAGPAGEPQQIPVEAGRMPDCAKIIDVIRREAGTKQTTAVARFNPRYLQNVADIAVAMGIERLELTFAPRLNFLMAEGTGPDGCHAAFAIAGIGDIDFDELASRATPAWERDDAMTFVMPEPRPRQSSKRSAIPTGPTLPLDDLPF